MTQWLQLFCVLKYFWTSTAIYYLVCLVRQFMVNSFHIWCCIFYTYSAVAVALIVYIFAFKYYLQFVLRVIVFRIATCVSNGLWLSYSKVIYYLVCLVRQFLINFFMFDVVFFIHTCFQLLFAVCFLCNWNW